MMRVAIRNDSTVLSDQELRAVLPALQTQVSRDFAPAYGVDARLRFLTKGAALDAAEWLLSVLDVADEDALGYHATTGRGQPIGKVFAKTTIEAGDKWSVTLSHELLELLADPFIITCVMDEKAQRIYSYEVCDATEDDSLGYDIAGVRVSDWVLPGYWERDIAPRYPLSFCGHVHKPFEIAPGGYMSFIDLKAPHKGWQSLPAERRRAGTHRGTVRRKLLAAVDSSV